MSHAQSLLLVLTLQAPVWKQCCTFVLSFFFSSHLIQTYIHLSCIPSTAQSAVCPLVGNTLRVCTSPKSPNSHSQLFSSSSSSVASADLGFALSLCPSTKKDPRCWPMSPELIDGCTVLGNVGEVQRLVPAGQRRSTLKYVYTACQYISQTKTGQPCLEHTQSRADEIVTRKIVYNVSCIGMFAHQQGFYAV